MKKFTSLCLAVTGVLLTQVVYADSAKLVNPANGHSYKRFDTLKTWEDAKNSCASQGGHLATVTDKAENDWIEANLVKGSHVWIGGFTQNGDIWQWITDEKWNYTNWSVGEPNDKTTGVITTCLSMNWPGQNKGSWDDYPCNYTSPTPPNTYLCEWESSTAKLYSQIATIPDINSNGAPELALLGEQGTNYKLFVYDSLTQALLSESVIKAKKGYALKSFSVVNDSNGNGAPEVAILINKPIDKTSVLQFQDTLSGDIVKTLNLPKN